MSVTDIRSETPSSVMNTSISNVSPPRIAPRCVTGACHPANRKSMDWSESCGLIAYGSHGAVVVVDAVSLQVVQCLDNEHRSSVVKVAWTKTNCASKHLADRMTLASSDTSGKILVWNVKSGEVKARMQDTSCTGPIYALTWMDGRIENTGHLILALHPPFHLILWDTSTGTKVWKKTYDSVLVNFELDPFDANRLALRCADGITLVNDFRPSSNSTPPSGQGKRLHLLGPSSSVSWGTASRSHSNSPRAANTSISSIGSENFSDSMSGDKGKVTRAKIKSMVKELVTGEAQHHPGDASNGGLSGSLHVSECLQVLFHSSARNHLLLVYPRVIYIVDLEIGQTIGCIGGSNLNSNNGGCERPNNPLSPILQVYPCSQRNALYVLHENGTVSLRARRGVFPKFSISRTGNSGFPRSISLTASMSSSSEESKAKHERFYRPNDSSNIGLVRDDDTLEICYDLKGITCDSAIRLASGAKGAKVLGMACNTVSENQLMVLTSDGRLSLIEVDLINNNNLQIQRYAQSETRNHIPRPVLGLEDMIPGTVSRLLSTETNSENGNKDNDHASLSHLKIQTTGIIGGLLPPPFVIRMCPPLTVKNFNDYRPLIAIGAINGSMQVLDASTGRIVREFATHTYPVQGLEWTSLNSILSYGYQNLSGSTNSSASNISTSASVISGAIGSSSSAGAANFVRNELMHTDIRTGKSRSLRAHRSEEPPIDMVRVSHLKQYFIVAFVGAPFELWDLRTLTLLRTMPKKFPPITALDWSPLHNLKHLKRKEREKFEREQRSKERESSDLNKDKNLSTEDSVTSNVSLESKMATEDPNTSTSPLSAKLDQSGNVESSGMQLVAKEHFVFTDPEGQLYHFSVEGNTIRDGTKIAAESGLGNPVTFIAWKSDHVVRSDVDGNINVWEVKHKATRNLTASYRSPIKKVRFAPGRGNLKLLVLQKDAVSIWDIKDCELISELRSPKDIVSRPIDIDWAASDRPIIATADGCIRILSLQLTSSTSPMMDYERKELGIVRETLDNYENLALTTVVACHSLMQNKARNNFQVILHHQPWKESNTYQPKSPELEKNQKEMSPPITKFDMHFDENDGFSSLEVQFFQDQIAVMDTNLKDYLITPNITPIERCLSVAQYCGLTWESDFWRVLNAVISRDDNSLLPKCNTNSSSDIQNNDVCKTNPTEYENNTKYLDLKFDLACENYAYAKYQKERLCLHETKCRYETNQVPNGSSYDVEAMRIRRSNVIDKMLSLGMKDQAVKMLLESTAATDPSEPTFYEYNLRACLVATCRPPGQTYGDEIDGSNSTTKLVATNLISEGRLWEGIQLLCLIGKYIDACQYLQSSGEWDDSVWLSKCRLSITTDASEIKGLEKIIEKYCDHISATRGQKKKAILIQLSTLMVNKANGCRKSAEEIGNAFVNVLDNLLSAKMIGLAGRFLDVCQTQLKGILPDTSHAMVVCEEVNLAYARHLFFDCGNANAAFFYCKKADEKGEILEREIETLLSGSSGIEKGSSSSPLLDSSKSLDKDA